MSAHAGTEHSLEGMRILVVEDNFLVASALRRRLAAWGCEVIGPVSSVDDGTQAVKREANLSGAILDINIAGGTSEIIAKALDERGRPYFFITGYSSPSMLSDALKSHRRLHKPIDDVTLKATILEEFKPATRA